MALKLLCLVILTVSAVTSITLKVGLYNYIPDLADDSLASYKDFIKSQWDVKGTGINLELIVNSTLYDPYGDLTEYLGDGEESFDLIETDMARKKELIGMYSKRIECSNRIGLIFSIVPTIRRPNSSQDRKNQYF